jgi:hypothetical protein
MKAYHFIAPDLRTRYDNLQAAVGETLKVDEAKVQLCAFGLHASMTQRIRDEVQRLVNEAMGDVI